jgi:hypothetical protein
MAGVQGFNITDIFPGLGDWVQGTRDARNQASRGQAVNQANVLLGAPAASTFQQGPDGLITGVSTQGSGLMQDPRDLGNQQRYGLGLMGNEFTDQAGQSYLSQINADFLGQPERDRNFNQQQAQFNIVNAKAAQDKQIAAQAVIDKRRIDDQALTNTYRDDFNKAAAPFATGVDIYQDFQSMAKARGAVSNWTLVDDVATIKNAAKLILPKEAVIGDDASLLAATSQLTPALQAMVSDALGMQKPLTDDQRRDLAQTIQERGGASLQRLESLEGDYRKSAAQNQLLDNQIISSRALADTNRYTKPPSARPGGRGASGSDFKPPGTDNGLEVPGPELQQILTDQYNRDNPNLIQQFGNWVQNF